MNDVLLEFTVIEDMVRVAAIDDATGTEAILIGPTSVGRDALGQAAAQKLRYVMDKRAAPVTPETPRPGYWA